MTRLPVQPGVPRSMLKRATPAHTDAEVASPHRAGHYSGLHPEDQPYQSEEIRDPRRASTRRPEPIQVDDEFEEEAYEEEEDDGIDTGYDDPPRMPSSVRRYAPIQTASPRTVWRVQYYTSAVPPRASRTQTQDYRPPAPQPAPAPQPEPRATRPKSHPRSFPRIHWTWYVGAALLLMLLGWQGLNALGQWDPGQRR
jgi:hypothetical protein